MNNGFHISKNFLRNVGVVLIGLVVIAITVYGISYLVSYLAPDEPIVNANMSPTADKINNKNVQDADGNAYKVSNNVEALLLLGIDKYSGETVTDNTINNQQADVVLLCVLDHTAQEYTLVQINRDTITKFDALGATGDAHEIEGQIALSHAYGTGGNDSCYNTLRAVEYLFYDIDVEHFASIKLDAVPIMNDAVGGVEVELLDDFTMINDSMVKGATVTLVGDQATKYIRARGELEDSTNLSRMERQRQYMSAWSDAFFETRAHNPGITASIYSDIQNYVVSNIDIFELEHFVECFDTYRSNGIIVPQGESKEVTKAGETHIEHYVDDAALRELVIDLFCGEDGNTSHTAAQTTTSQTSATQTTGTTQETTALTEDANVTEPNDSEESE